MFRGSRFKFRVVGFEAYMIPGFRGKGLELRVFRVRVKGLRGLGFRV